MGNFLVIDGSSMLTTNYYGTLPPAIRYAKTQEQKEEAYKQILQTSTGVYTNGIVTSLRMILDIVLNYPEITHMAVVFDKTRNTFRRKEYSEYKANRKPTPSPLKEQFIRLENILNEIGIKTMCDDTFEADDIAGSIIQTFSSVDMHMIFMTKDHDYLQLINSNVSGWIVQSSAEKAKEIMEKRGLDISSLHIPNKVALFDSDTVFQEEGVWPSQIVDKKGLCGDSSDNIPGIKGVGETVVIPLLHRYTNIENLYSEIDKVVGNKSAMSELNKMWKNELHISRSPFNKLVDSKDMAILSKSLATIRCDVSIDEDISNYCKKVDTNALSKVIQEYEMYSLQSYVNYPDLRLTP